MNSDEILAHLIAAQSLAHEACEICGEAILRWDRGDHAGFARLIREGITKLGCATVLFEAIATECDRLAAS